MNCWNCERPARGVCIFCGRGVCKEHTQNLPNIVGVFTDADKASKAIVVEDALYCGECKPKGDPVKLDDLA